jgi:hypothetical protein
MSEVEEDVAFLPTCMVLPRIEVIQNVLDFTLIDDLINIIIAYDHFEMKVGTKLSCFMWSNN